MSASLSPSELEKTPAPETEGFSDLGLSPVLLAVLEQKGYTAPTPIQAQAIPPLLAGRDLIGQAQTGTGKTAAFTLPLLSRLDLRRREVQAIVLAPTRELAMQVSEALSGYGAGLGALEVVTIYGGAAIGKQIARLRAGVHVVVGTPGRILDCMRRGALSLDAVSVAVVDEADEMLRMGFIDDVETILGATPAARQTALFSATMAPEIERVARKYLRDPVKVNVKHATRTVANIEQHVLCVSEGRKLEALTRLIEAADHQAMLVFVRTRATCAELAEALESRGHATAALHGDMSQSQREDVLRRLRAGRMDLLIATDVAARGLDVDDITHVVNFDPPMDPDTYVHRIGRTGRAGRDGASLLMLTPRQRGIRSAIERHTRQPMTEIRVPSNADLAWALKERFKAAALRAVEEEGLEVYEGVVAELLADGLSPERLAAGLASMACRHRPLLPTGEHTAASGSAPAATPRGAAPPAAAPAPSVAAKVAAIAAPVPPAAPAAPTEPAARPAPAPAARAVPAPAPARGAEWSPLDEEAPPPQEVRRPRREHPPTDAFTEMFLGIGQNAGLRAGDLVGAVTNEAGVPGDAIGAIHIGPHSTVFGLAPGYVDAVLRKMSTAFIRGRKTFIAVARQDGSAPARSERAPRPAPRAASHRGGGRPGASGGGSAPPRRATGPRRRS